jgi:hypothetical protein
MSAENVQGLLLEEYIDANVSSLGWVWCKGSTMRAVDFCTMDGDILLQIKNKSNSENSSSSSIRNGTDIHKWFRLGTQTKAGKKYPVYKWDDLNGIIAQANNGIPEMSEDSYRQFIQDVAKMNPNIITDE